MAREAIGPLDSGERFPDMEFTKAGGGTFSTGRDLAGSWSVLLVYRGSW